MTADQWVALAVWTVGCFLGGVVLRGGWRGRGARRAWLIAAMTGPLSRWRARQAVRNARDWAKWEVGASARLAEIPMPLPPGRIVHLAPGEQAHLQEEKQPVTITLYAVGRTIAFGEKLIAESVVREWKNARDLDTHGSTLRFTDEAGRAVRLIPGGGSVVVEE